MHDSRLSSLAADWFEKGQQRIIPTTGKHRGVKLLAIADYVPGNIVWQEDEQYTAETFWVFLKKVPGHYPTGKIVIVLDNVRIHHAKGIHGRDCERYTNDH